MPRKFVISLCLLNLIIAVALLWIFIPKQWSNSSLPKVAEVNKAKQLTEAQLWEKAKGSTTPREAFSHLSKTTDASKLHEEMDILLSIFRENDSLPRDHWAFYQGLLQAHASNAMAIEELNELPEIFDLETPPLTFRSLAFTLYVKHCFRLQSAQQSYSLIDAAFKEANSLKRQSLRADSFLQSKGIVDQPRQNQMIQRSISILTDINALEDNQFTAIEILAQSVETAKIPLETIFKNAKSERVQNALLQLTLSNEIQKEWLDTIQAISPQQEQLLMQVKHHFHQHGKE